MSPIDPTGSADRTLRDLLRTDGRLSFERATRILADVAEALAPMHAAGQAHGAITPQSVHLDAAGRATLGPPVADTTSTGLLPPAYLPPERIGGDPADPRSDVYSLGLVGWEMLTGQTPWAGQSLTEILIDQQEQDLPRLTTVRPGVPRPLLLAIEGALHKSPTDRWATAGELLATLGAPDAPTARPVETPAVVLGPITAHREPIVPVRPVATPVRRTRRGRKVAMVALALAVVVAGGAALASVQGREKQRVTAPWLDSLTTSTSAGVVITDDTLNGSAARVRAQRARQESLAAYGASVPVPPPPAAYPMPAPTPYRPAPEPPATVVPPPAPTPTSEPADLRTPAEQAAQDAALARARAESARQRAAADSARRAAVPSSAPTSAPAAPPSSQPATPDSARDKPAPADTTTRKPKPDSTTKPDTSGAGRR